MRSTLLISVFIMQLTFPGCITTSEDEYLKHIREQREAIDELFKDSKSSPLSDEDIQAFEGLKYFPVDRKFRINARLEKDTIENIIEFPHTMNRKYPYLCYGRVYFKINNQNCSLRVFMNEEFSKSKEGAGPRRLFIPFTDLTNDSITYEGGRYIDVELPADTQLVIDFNTSYNPYCAYNPFYSCPIVPEENFLNYRITAGELRFKDVGLSDNKTDH